MLHAIEPDATRGRSAAVVVSRGALVHTATLLPVDAAGTLVGGADAGAQTRQVIANLGAALAAAGSGLDRVARLHVYVADASVTPVVDAAIAATFTSAVRPAVTLVESRLPLAGAQVALDAIAVTARPRGTTPERLRVAGAAAALGGGALVAVQPEGPFVIVSGRAAPGELVTAARDTMKQLRGDLEGAGLTFEHAVHVKAFLGDMSRAAELAQTVASMFEGDAPPLVITEWRGGSLPVEIELMAVAPGAAAGTERVTFTEPIMARYSRVARIFSGRPVFVSGLVGSSAEPKTQVREIFAELRRVVDAAGSDMRHIAKATYYVADTGADQEINTVRPSIYDPARPPAASKISVQGAGRPGKLTVIDAIAVTTAR
jgi:enamine deaminase RidA (YjgF/YER057c/UK114 family)